ncbi:hypothetical protein M758_1G125400 [Ceratodon purpureus]|nr:hypothetical protein M758_1G125400 [Ceratodon purpureus]
MGEYGVPTEAPHGVTSSNGGTATANGSESGEKSKVGLSSLWKGHTVFDAWLIAAAGQIGFVLVTLPYTMSQMGFAWGSAASVLYGLIGAWCVYLLVWLYLEFKSRIDLQGKVRPENYILQYHEVIGELTGRWGRKITYFYIIFTLFMASIICVVASSSNLYYANPRLNKREWTYIAGGVSFLAVLVPDFGHFRSGAFIGVITTTITSIYLLVAALSYGQRPGVKHTGANDMVEFFSGVGNILGAYGGHGITIEILETMKRPSAYKYVNLAVFFYALLVTIPSSVAVYWSAGDILLKQSNAFAVLPSSGWQTLAIATIIAHQAMGFILFTHPIFLLCEKAAGVHTRRFFLRVLCRIPVVAIMFFFALAVPFFGPINSLLGSFGVGLGMYLIPAVVFLVTYRTKSARENSPVKPPWFLPTWSLVFVVNVVVILWTLVVGVGLGGWAGISNLIRQVHSFGFFDKCFQCPPKPK